MKKVQPKMEIDGVHDFGTFCGFDLDQCPYRMKGVRMEPLLYGRERSRAIADCLMVAEIAGRHPLRDAPAPSAFPVSPSDAECVSASIAPPTPKGREPRYPLTVSLSATSPIYEPEDWEAWMDAYVECGGKLKAPAVEGGGQMVVFHLGYLSGGDVGKATVTLWDRKLGHSFTLGMTGGELKLKKIERKHVDDDGWEVIFKP